MEAQWVQISKEVISALDLTTSEPKEFKRIDSLYRRCLMCVPGFQEKKIDSDRLHECVLAAIQMIQHNWPDANPKDLRVKLEDIFHLGDQLIDQAVNIAICLWIGVDCVGPRHSIPKNWPEADSVQNFVLKRRFDDPTETSIGDSVARFPPKFRAARLEDISGISIESTYYLDQHLRFNEDTRTLKVFMDAVWLQSMCKRFCEVREAPEQVPEQASRHGSHSSPSSQSPSSPAPSAANHTSAKSQASDCDVHATSLAPEKRISLKSGTCGRSKAAHELLPLFEETLRTLDVLFPAWDPSTIEFVAAIGSGENVISPFKLEDLYPQQQQGLNKFKFWRARLAELILEHQSPPRDWRQIWKDRRNPMAFWTFWIGLMIFLLTLVFGVIASVLTGMTLAKEFSSN